MIEKVKTYFEKLESLSTEELDHSTEKLVRDEKRNVALVIAHIAEMSRRKGHLECGYENLFAYCTKRLNLSEGSVARRIQVANVALRFPQILVAVAENRLSLTVAGLLAPHLRGATSRDFWPIALVRPGARLRNTSSCCGQSRSLRHRSEWRPLPRCLPGNHPQRR